MIQKSSLQELLQSPDPIIMGIVNATPNSFSDGGDYLNPNVAIDRAHKMVEEGATIIDIGAESSNPKATPITAAEEIERLLPIVQSLVKSCHALISIDTYHPETMKIMINEGIDIINDINGFRNLASIEAVKDSSVDLVVMHLDHPLESMHVETQHDDIVESLMTYFKERQCTLNHHGIQDHRIIIDPGFGFGKTIHEQIILLKNLNALTALSFPLLIGLSRKRLIGHLTNVDIAKDRTIGNITAALWCLTQQAKIFRVHDVHETQQAFHLWQQLNN